MNPMKLLGFLLAVSLLLCFAGFNLGNYSDVSLGFYTFRDTPVFISLPAAFIAGSLVTLAACFFTWKAGRKTGGEREIRSRSGSRKPIKKRKQTIPDMDPDFHDDGAE